jgi:hypothetical protein
MCSTNACMHPSIRLSVYLSNCPSNSAFLLQFMVLAVKPFLTLHTHSIFCRVFFSVGILLVYTEESVSLYFRQVQFCLHSSAQLCAHCIFSSFLLSLFLMWCSLVQSLAVLKCVIPAWTSAGVRDFFFQYVYFCVCMCGMCYNLWAQSVYHWLCKNHLKKNLFTECREPEIERLEQTSFCIYG